MNGHIATPGAQREHRTFSLASWRSCFFVREMENAMKRLLPLIAPALLLAACATVSPEAKVRNALLDAGLSPPMAGCMAERMVDRLSIPQLRRLQSLGKLAHRDIRAMTVDEFLWHVRALEDPEIFSVVSRVGVGCAIAG
jgi:hypothetical protein